ncbi:MAG TPA: M28 family peptidase, partial [Ktedonobacteraceae bacterium]|nr:M28 family peptidase [Ktedonobacteraceae bacterium]
MLRRVIRMCCLCTLICNFLVPATASSAATTIASRQATAAAFPTVDPNYIYNQLFYMATHFQHRSAGYNVNQGHDQFAAYWSQEMVRNLQGFAPQVRRDNFPFAGWRGAPATVPAFNVEVSVPGITHPEQEVVIGCHYDGQISSTQSANDDASGCAIELGVAKGLAAYWQSHHLYPARTLRFVIFDAEESGLNGSFYYVDNTVNGDIKNIVAMINEEQNGIAYPLRYLGQVSNPVLPFYIFTSPLQNNDFYSGRDKLTQQQRGNITLFDALMQEAITDVFAQFRAMGYQMLSYHNSNHQDVLQPIFTPDQYNSIQMQEDSLAGSDEVPFTIAGLPCATLVGNFTYYDSNPPPWSYPYDQPTDTIQLMNTFADGSSQQSQALTLALALPGMLTTWMLNRPEILGTASVDQNPVAAISDIGATRVGRTLSLDAKASFNPNGNNSDLSYAWNFGDGTRGAGIAVTHTYKAAGSYTLTLTVSSPIGKRTVTKMLNVTTQPIATNPVQLNQDGKPQPNPAVTLPTPDNSLSDKVALAPTTVASVPLPGTTGQAVGLYIGLG